MLLLTQGDGVDCKLNRHVINTTTGPLLFDSQLDALSWSCRTFHHRREKSWRGYICDINIAINCFQNILRHNSVTLDCLYDS
jgi:hypothetical protein